MWPEVLWNYGDLASVGNRRSRAGVGTEMTAESSPLGRGEGLNCWRR